MVNSREEFLDVRLEFYPLCLIERPFLADSVVNTLPLLGKKTRLWNKLTAPNGLQCRRVIAFELTSVAWIPGFSVQHIAGNRHSTC